MTFAIYVMGHLTWSLQLLQAQLEGGLAARLVDIMYRIMPNFERLNLKSAAVHGLPLESGFTLSVVYGLSYAVVILGLACMAFARKEFN